MNFRNKLLRLSSMFALLLTVAANANAEVGFVEIRVTDHKPGIDQFRSLDVTLDEISLHQKGFGRKTGWIRFASDTNDFAAIDIVPLKDGRYRSLGESRVPLGSYDAIKINFSKAVGQLKTDAQALVLANDTILATAITVNSTSNPPILIDLYAEDQTEHEAPKYVVKVKEIRIVDKNLSANQMAE